MKNYIERFYGIQTESEDSEFAKKAILEILKSQKVSLSKVRYLFNSILREIEDNNPIML